ncbi:MAG TPA: polysaccharide deacetylase family protein [Sphingomicrobium sp.]|nr:polysaccharide deacetylase family protein [Sphingomicrobium sp.]
MSKRCLAAAVLLLASCASAPELAITIDDLPVHSPYPPGTTPLEVSQEMIAALKSGGVPATTFVNGVNAKDGPTMEALEDWRDAGFILGNHSWSHRHLNEMSVDEFETELTRNEPLLERLGGNSDWRWFRYPFLDEGKDEAQRIEARRVLQRRGYRVADVTMSFSDWQFTPAYARCVAAGDKQAIAELERMYMEVAEKNIPVARETARKLYGRDIPFVLLMHVSAMSAHMMPEVIELYRKSGFRFVTLSKAESDPAYRSDIDLSAERLSQWDLAKAKGVDLPLPPDPSAKLAAMCPGGPTVTNP